MIDTNKDVRRKACVVCGVVVLWGYLDDGTTLAVDVEPKAGGAFRFRNRHGALTIDFPEMRDEGEHYARHRCRPISPRLDRIYDF